ncbi:RNA polymerase subunit sigma-24 [Agromyces mariniharenae]|uniref:RNA polymerase subunit sigma-24 n=1 Tax=Agromyces mariniharenae TaxID=2604423 RepID=A0A5S4VGB0_9MICO|nr:RNA polymerase subunit sigma-24 [Agromyces mariniharenae]
MTGSDESESGAGAGDALAPDVAVALREAYRSEWARVVATLIRVTGDWDVAEEAASGAFERAATTWARDGVPRNPGAWLTTAARNLALDRLRRRGVEAEKVREWMAMEEFSGRADGPRDPADVVADDEPAWDDRLRLVFTCAHPALSMDARVALTLRTVGGLDTGEIARAFHVPEATMAQRIVRAKRRIRHAGIPYRVPTAALLPERLGGVLAVLYLVANEGYLASHGDELQRLDLSIEAIRLTRTVVALLPDADEARALLALLLLQHARSAARADADGELVPLPEQDRSTWDADELAEGLELLEAPAGSDGPADPPGPYRLQAEIQAVHARARTADDTDWAAIVDRYDALAALADSPFVVLNRAIARGMAFGPEHGLDDLALLEASGRLDGYHLLPAAQADLLRRLGRTDAAAARYREAIALARTAPERRFLERRLAELG